MVLMLILYFTHQVPYYICYTVCTSFYGTVLCGAALRCLALLGGVLVLVLLVLLVPVLVVVPVLSLLLVLVLALAPCCSALHCNIQ
jgi:hypothetical protein